MDHPGQRVGSGVFAGQQHRQHIAGHLLVVDSAAGLVGGEVVGGGGGIVGGTVAVGEVVGSGTGTGGSELPNVAAEFTNKAKFVRGTCGMARSANPDSANSQFYIMFAPAPSLDGGYTIFGECAPEQIVHDIASVSVSGERPTTEVKIKSVTISRDEKKSK